MAHPHRSVPSRSRAAIIASLCGLAVLVLYTRTLQPGVGGPEDTPKFQYLGYVLGTAHSPGYPLYTILTHLFSYLPLGSIARRMNLFSAVCGAVTVAFAWGVARQLGASRIGATGAALALGCGRYFWWNSILAEVYTLGTALLAGMIFFLLRWSHGRRNRDLHLAVACAALALGNHLTIVAVAPAAILFVLVVDWRAALRPRTLLLNLVIGVAGIAQYAYIIVRTRQHAPYLESQARTLAELIPIIRAERFSKDVFSFSWTALFTERVPDLLGHLLGELGWWGAVFVIGGLVLLAVRRWRHALLIGAGALGAFYLAVNVSADVKGFLMPVFTLLWPAAALGIDGLARLAARLPLRVAGAIAVLAAVLLPAGLVRANFRANDLSGHTATERYVDAIFDSLPPRAAFVAEEYTTDSILRYQSIAHPGSGQRLQLALPPDPAVVRHMNDAGFAVFAFRQGAGSLVANGLEASRATVRGPDVRTVVDAFPGDHTAVVAAYAPGLPLSFAPESGRAAGWPAAARRLYHAVLARPGRWNAALFDSRNEPFTTGFGAGAAPGPIGGSLPRAIAIEAGRDRAAILIDGREAIRAEPGIAVLVLAPDGTVVFRKAWPPGAPLDTVLDIQQPALYRIGAPMACTALGDRAWRDITARAATSGLLLRVNNYRPATGEFTLYALSDLPFAPVLRPEVDSPPQQLDVRRFDLRNAEDAAALRENLRRDAVSIPFDSPGATYAARFHAALPDNGESAAARLYFGTRALQVIARGTADLPALPRAAVCAAPWPRVIGLWTPLSGEVWLGPGAAEYFGTGWRGAERDAASDRPIRWTATTRARLRLPMPAPAPTRVQATLEPAPGVTGVTIEVNATRMPPLPLHAGWQDVDWTVPADAWHEGVNDVWLVTEGTPRSAGRGLHVKRIRLEQRPQ